MKSMFFGALALAAFVRPAAAADYNQYVLEAVQSMPEGGRLILMGPTEKLKRQIGIYGSLKNVMVKKSELAPEEQPSVGLPVHDEIPGF